MIGLRILLETATPPDISGITGTVTSLLTALTGWMTSITSWIMADPLAVVFFAIMFLMLALHLLNSVVHQFS